MKKVLVIGSNSFSGSDFIDLLLEQGEYQVFGISRSLEKPAALLPYKKNNLKNFTFRQIDLNHDLKKLETLIDDFQPQFIVNFAAQSEVGPSWKNPDHWFQTNAVALTRLVNILKDKKYLKNYLHVSSPEVYGACSGTFTEESPVNPTTPYAASKAAGDFSLFTFSKNFSFPLTMVRATNVYGPYQQLFKIIPRAIIYMKLGKVIPIDGGGVAQKSYIHIRDVSRGELAIMEHGRKGEIYHLSPDNAIAIKDLVKIIANKMQCDYNKVTQVAPERLGQDAIYQIDSTKARKEFGWIPQISIDKGIADTVQWIEANWSFIKDQPLEYIHKA